MMCLSSGQQVDLLFLTLHLTPYMTLVLTLLAA